MPNGPNKTALLNILMRISQAITELKSAIYESMEGTPPKAGKSPAPNLNSLLRASKNKWMVLEVSDKTEKSR